MNRNFLFGKWFGSISAFALFAAALAPDLFGVPVDIRPWVFVLAIFWYLMVASGIFI